MDKEKLKKLEEIAFEALVNAIGRDFVRRHKDASIFAMEEPEDEEDIKNGLYCFLGIDLHPENRQLCLRGGSDEWDIYASGHVFEDKFVLGECKLPHSFP